MSLFWIIWSSIWKHQWEALYKVNVMLCKNLLWIVMKGLEAYQMESFLNYYIKNKFVFSTW